jgi:hypothetical protein
MTATVYKVSTRYFGVIEVVANNIGDARRIARRWGVHDAAAVWRAVAGPVCPACETRPCCCPRGTVWLLNSAVIPNGGWGTFDYSPCTVERLRAALSEPYTSRVGYAQTAWAIEALTGFRPELSRGGYTLAVGDVAYVVRLLRRVSDPSTKGRVPVGPTDYELGVLTRVK